MNRIQFIIGLSLTLGLFPSCGNKPSASSDDFDEEESEEVVMDEEEDSPVVGKKDNPSEKDDPVEETSVYDIAEQMPEFKGGNTALHKWLESNIEYPASARNSGKEGNVILSFVVERDGSISDVKVIKSLDPELDKEAVRVVGNMPKWMPGMQDGKTVRVKFMLPIRFSLQ